MGEAWFVAIIKKKTYEMTDLNTLEIDTPALLIDLDVLEKNLETMQTKAGKHNVALRPHIKAHKIPELARLQIRMGASGVTASKVSEAQVMVESGIDDIFIANQVVTESKLKRLASLARRSRISVGLDSREGAEILSKVFSAEKKAIDYVIEIDTGLNRCGVLPGRPAIELYQAIENLPGIRFKGIFTHAGQVYGKQNLEEVKAVSRLESEAMAKTAEKFNTLGVHPDIVSVGSTPTMRVWDGYAGINEIRPGNYIFLDAIQIALGVADQKECALTILSTVTSRPAVDRAVIDAGSKVLALDKGAHGTELIQGFGLIPGKGATIARLSEEHGILWLDPEEKLTIGEQIRIIPNHACTAINLADKAFGIRQGRVEEEFVIAARGKVA